MQLFGRPLLLAVLIGLSVPLSAGTQSVAAQDRGVPSRNGLVVSTDSIASEVGAAVLRRGGNAVDATIATSFALAVTHPAAGNIGGGGFMIIAPPGAEPVTIDYRERAPGRSTPTMYLASDGSIDRSLTATGYLAPGVPGTVRGLVLAHERFGSLPWSDLVLPAVELAERGFLLPESLARGLNAQVSGPMKPFPASVAAYGKPGGGEWEAGDRIILADLGRTLRALATDGADAFYRGWIADRIADDLAAHGGIITRDDLAAYEAKVRAPVRGTYKGYDVISMAPPSSGGTALIEMLNLVEPLDLGRQTRLAPETLHWLIEARRLAFLDRARHLGDPDFVSVPVARLTAKAHADSLRALVSPDGAGNSVELGKDIVTVTDTESDETTHFSVLDRDGLAVSTTTTLEGGYGSHVVVEGAGFILNNEMGDFNRKPGETNTQGDIGTAANLIAPGKRMLSSMTPTIVQRNGRALLITGSPGGRTIINTVFDIVLNVLEFGMSARDAVDTPRLHHQWLPDRATLEADAVAPSVLDSLRAMGHTIIMRGRQGDGHTIVVDPDTGIAWGAADRRSSNSRVAVP